MHDFTHRLTRIFRPTHHSTHARSKRSFNFYNRVEAKIKWTNGESSRYHHAHISSKPHHTRHSTQSSIMTLQVMLTCNGHCKTDLDILASHNEILRVHTRLMELKFPCWTCTTYYTSERLFNSLVLVTTDTQMYRRTSKKFKNEAIKREINEINPYSFTFQGDQFFTKHSRNKT
ncbi:hypothetical protein H5410_041498 [Solanum commersonii]|uniref:Uncharacterized protein n=1 Tax=Solanum commersonii TaxID=4109 RepID=A0A9J5XUX9_SOLCO|nr:hypothetical protein H5410_041498 [Solanum commersonii]